MKSDASMKRIAVFASGNGSNAENIIRYFNTGAGAPSHGAEVVLVVCNRPGAAVIDKARALGVPVSIVTREMFNDEASMMALLESRAIDAIVLAGFLLMVPPFMTARFSGRMINIHPSLLPKFGGKGMYGRHVHEAVVAAGETETGITVHLVSDHCDGGDIIFQASTPVAPTDTAADVETKVHALERAHFPAVIARWLHPSE